MLLPRRIAAFIVAALVAGCGSLGFGEGGEGLTPAGTVEGYLDASVTGDCRVASRLATPDLVRQGLWCDNPRVLSFGELEVLEGTAADLSMTYAVDAVVIGGTGLEQRGLRAGENEVIVRVVRETGGTWRVSETSARLPPLQPGP